MAIEPRTTAPNPSRMGSMRKVAFVAGLLYLITYLAIPTIALYGPVLSDPGFIVELGQPRWRALGRRP